MTAPTCHDLPELIEGEPATAWSWGEPCHEPEPGDAPEPANDN
jgi:hypothetical protein